MPDLIRHPVYFWIPAFAGMTTVGYFTAGAILAVFHVACDGSSSGGGKSGDVIKPAIKYVHKNMCSATIAGVP
jgi:hypothetical protein